MNIVPRNHLIEDDYMHLSNQVPNNEWWYITWYDEQNDSLFFFALHPFVSEHGNELKSGRCTLFINDKNGISRTFSDPIVGMQIDKEKKILVWDSGARIQIKDNQYHWEIQNNHFHLHLQAMPKLRGFTINTENMHWSSPSPLMKFTGSLQLMKSSKILIDTFGYMDHNWGNFLLNDFRWYWGSAHSFKKQISVTFYLSSHGMKQSGMIILCTRDKPKFIPIDDNLHMPEEIPTKIQNFTIEASAQGVNIAIQCAHSSSNIIYGINTMRTHFTINIKIRGKSINFTSTGLAELKV